MSGKVLLHDLPSLSGIHDIQELNSLFTTLAFNSANEVSLQELSRNSGVAGPTIKRYIEYLEAAFLVKVVHKVDRGARRFKRATRFKVYLTNPSMRSALLSILRDSDDAMGSMVETAVMCQWFHEETPIYYARWATGEVDVVRVNADQRISFAMEVKWSDRCVPRPRDLKSLLSFARAHGLTEVVASTKRASVIRKVKDTDIYFWPSSLYCFALGYGVVKRRLDGLEMAN